MKASFKMYCGTCYRPTFHVLEGGTWVCLAHQPPAPAAALAAVATGRECCGAPMELSGGYLKCTSGRHDD